MTGEQWNEKDQAFINDAVHDVNVPYGEKVYLKRYIGIADAGDPIAGIQAKSAYKITPVQAIINTVSAADALYSGGLYLTSDLRVSLTQKLNFIDSTVQIGGQSQGDRIIWHEHEYRIVGRWDCEPLLGDDKAFVYVFRKVGNA